MIPNTFIAPIYCNVILLNSIAYPKKKELKFNTFFHKNSNRTIGLRQIIPYCMHCQAFKHFEMPKTVDTCRDVIDHLRL